MQDNNAHEMPIGDLGPNIPNGTCDQAPAVQGQKISLIKAANVKEKNFYRMYR